MLNIIKYSILFIKILTLLHLVLFPVSTTPTDDNGTGEPPRSKIPRLDESHGTTVSRSDAHSDDSTTSPTGYHTDAAGSISSQAGELVTNSGGDSNHSSSASTEVPTRRVLCQGLYRWSGSRPPPSDCECDDCNADWRLTQDFEAWDENQFDGSGNEADSEEDTDETASINSDDSYVARIYDLDSDEERAIDAEEAAEVSENVEPRYELERQNAIFFQLGSIGSLHVRCLQAMEKALTGGLDEKGLLRYTLEANAFRSMKPSDVFFYEDFLQNASH